MTFDNSIKPSDLILFDPIIGGGCADFALDGTDDLIQASNDIREAAGMTDLFDLEPDNPVYYTYMINANAETRNVALSFTANETIDDDYENYPIPLSEEKSHELFRAVLDQVKEVNSKHPDQDLVEFIAEAEKQPILYMPIGIPGSGKSTWAQSLMGVHIHSSDQIRRDFEKVGYEWTHADVFREMRERAVNDLQHGRSCVYDATSLRPWVREAMLEQCPGNVRKVAVMFETPIDVCIERNSKREGKARVPEDVIWGMAQGLTPPTLEEGFDDIIRIPWDRNLELTTPPKSPEQVLLPASTPDWSDVQPKEAEERSNTPDKDVERLGRIVAIKTLHQQKEPKQTKTKAHTRADE